MILCGIKTKEVCTGVFAVAAVAGAAQGCVLWRSFVPAPVLGAALALLFCFSISCDYPK